jgi:hypothetical protein
MKDFFEIELKPDVSVTELFTDATFRMIGPRGNVEYREKVLEDTRDPDPNNLVTTVEMKDLDVLLRGNAAVAIGVVRVAGRCKEKTYDSNFRFMDLLEMQAGGWKIVIHQLTLMRPSA